VFFAATLNRVKALAGRKRGRYGSHWGRGLSLGGLALFITLFVSLPSQGAMSRLNLAIAFPILLIIIMIGVAGDMVGVAAAASEEAPLHAMAAKRIGGARRAIQLVRHADRVASIACDVIGDIAASLSGAAGTAIVFRVASALDLRADLLATLMIALIAALTVGGKAAMKGVALRNANRIIFALGRLLDWFDRRRGKMKGKPGRKQG